ncbi:hypothetical protein HPB47_003711 [Ixodes persulcatus]|uniref:Uncharacterized protein n=1 Tax=Ixodes persulcatus TaxID=34615 RepID=A0AC60PIR3_IXOPE|nr:hypothetical protein HPB47_003711 [Ixodes persulcatus]
MLVLGTRPGDVGTPDALRPELEPCVREFGCRVSSLNYNARRFPRGPENDDEGARPWSRDRRLAPGDDSTTRFKMAADVSPKSSVWSRVKVLGEGPCPRRRQCCCMVGDRLFLFGGTSPIPNQGSVRERLQEFDMNDQALMDHSDLHVLDFAPTLKTLCLLAVINSRLDVSNLPQDIRQVDWSGSVILQHNGIVCPGLVFPAHGSFSKQELGLLRRR